MKKRKLNYTFEVGSKLTTLFIFLIFSFSESESESWFDGFRGRNFHAMYLAAGSFVFAEHAAEQHSLKLLKSSNKVQPCKRINKKQNSHFLERKYVFRHV